MIRGEKKSHHRECEPAQFPAGNALGQRIRDMRAHFPAARNCGEKWDTQGWSCSQH